MIEAALCGRCGLAIKPWEPGAWQSLDLSGDEVVRTWIHDRCMGKVKPRRIGPFRSAGAAGEAVGKIALHAARYPGAADN